MSTFKHNSSLTFSRFFAKLLATNCCLGIECNSPSYKCAFADVSRKRAVSLQNRYRKFVSVYDIKQHVKTFFLKTSSFDFWKTFNILRSQSVVQPR